MIFLETLFEIVAGAGAFLIIYLAIYIAAGGRGRHNPASDPAGDAGIQITVFIFSMFGLWAVGDLLLRLI